MLTKLLKAAQELKRFAKTAPGRLIQEVQDAVDTIEKIGATFDTLSSTERAVTVPNTAQKGMLDFYDELSDLLCKYDVDLVHGTEGLLTLFNATYGEKEAREAECHCHKILGPYYIRKALQQLNYVPQALTSSTFPNPLNIQLGDGQVGIAAFQDARGAGVMLKQNEIPQPVGSPIDGTHPDELNPHSPQKNEVYIHSTSSASLKVLQASVDKALGFLVGMEVGPSDDNSDPRGCQ